MAASIIDDWQSCKTMMQCNYYMWTNQIACDIKFLVGEHKECIPAHKYVLLSRSCVFYSMFCGPLAESQSDIPLPDIEPVVFKTLLEWVLIDHFRDLTTDSQTTDITHFAVVFKCDVTMEALEILWSTAKCLWRHNEKQLQSAWWP